MSTELEAQVNEASDAPKIWASAHRICGYIYLDVFHGNKRRGELVFPTDEEETFRKVFPMPWKEEKVRWARLGG